MQNGKRVWCKRTSEIGTVVYPCPGRLYAVQYEGPCAIPIWLEGKWESMYIETGSKCVVLEAEADLLENGGEA